MVKITLASSNAKKIKELKFLLEPEFEVEIRQAEYPEIQHDDPCAISLSAAKAVCEKLNRLVIVEDSGMHVDALNGFPGTMTKPVYSLIGNEGILKLMKGIKNRKAKYKSAVAICKPGKKAICFLGEEEGTIAQSIRGNGWGQDPIFIPKGSRKTYGEEPPKNFHPYREDAVKKLKAYFFK